jgi:DNA-binding XRE family transcriptional regulator
MLRSIDPVPKYMAGRCLLKNLRHAAGLTQEALSSLSGVSKSTISALENNRYVLNDLAIAKSLVKPLNCDIDDLYEWVKE